MTSTVKIKGMSCNHCVMAVTKALNEMQGITNVQVDLEKAQATFDYDETVDMNTVHQKIEKTGYEIG